MSYPYDPGPACHPSGEPFRNIFPRRPNCRCSLTPADEPADALYAILLCGCRIRISAEIANEPVLRCLYRHGGIAVPFVVETEPQ